MKWSRAFSSYSILPKKVDHIDILLAALDKSCAERPVRNHEAERLNEGLHDSNLDPDDHLSIFQEIYDER